MFKRSMVLCALSAWLAAATSVQATSLDASYAFGADSTIDYHLVHPLHRVKGVSHGLKGRIVVLKDRLQTPMTLELPLISFRSGNANRDGNAAATLEVQKFPLATLLVQRFEEKERASVGDALRVAGVAHGQLSLHGVSLPVAIPLTALARPGGVTVEAEFDVSLTAHAIPRPSLLFNPVEDNVKVVVHGVAHPAAANPSP
ncbi:MAG: YceI family protein [Candidatus Sericytochromatia bacterium]|nr:YceI family protein [Candidatus Sericytochromatia bacterium]